MIHATRTHGIRQVQTAETLSELLCEHDWTLCTGFEVAGLLFLNDSFSVCGAQEWAVLKQGRQVASLTITADAATLRRRIEGLLASVRGVVLRPRWPHAEPGDEHGCRLCA